ncbi:MAG: hypothetical protein ACR2J1_05050 [Methyloceanibacter sp.]|uniref:hypothetical protein n=1 Tax=Methyloceanibacter sp. TaxID=1965321 RepID=UPI003D9B9346
MTMPAHSDAISFVSPRPGERMHRHKPVRVMVVDDSAVVRGLVSRWIEEEPGLEVVARHPNGKVA